MQARWSDQSSPIWRPVSIRFFFINVFYTLNRVEKCFGKMKIAEPGTLNVTFNGQILESFALHALSVFRFYFAYN
jgi:hypothetical protein